MHQATPHLQNIPVYIWACVTPRFDRTKIAVTEMVVGVDEISVHSSTDLWISKVTCDHKKERDIARLTMSRRVLVINANTCHV